MKLRAWAVMALTGLSLTSGAAKAATFDFSYEAGGVSVSGVIMADMTITPGEYTATSISGTYGTESITGLSGYGSADQHVFYPTGPYVDLNGLGFSYGTSGAANLYYYSTNSSYMELVYPDPISPGDGVMATDVSFTEVVAVPPSTVPLPASAPMFGAGLIVLGAAGYAARRKKAAVAA